MDYFTNKRFVIWTIIVLVVLNLFTLSAFWLSMVINKPIFPIAKHDLIEDKERRPEDFLEEELKLSIDQKQHFEISSMKHTLRTKDIAREIHMRKRLLVDELFQQKPDTLKIQKLSEEIGMMQAGLEMVNNEHILELKSVCQPEQQEKLKLLFNEMLETSRPDEHRPPPPPSR